MIKRIYQDKLLPFFIYGFSKSPAGLSKILNNCTIFKKLYELSVTINNNTAQERLRIISNN